MLITRGELGRIVREEAARLQEARPGTSPRARRHGDSQPETGRGKPPWAGKGGGGGPTSPAERRKARSDASLGGPAARTLEDVGSYEAAQGGDEMRNFADALEGYADKLKGVRGGQATRLRDRLMQASNDMRQLSRFWDRVLLGPDDER